MDNSGTIIMAISLNGSSFNRENELIAKWAIFMAKTFETLLVADVNVPIDRYDPHRIIGNGKKGESIKIIDTIKSAFFLYSNFAKKEAAKEILIVTSPIYIDKAVRICKDFFQNTGIYVYGMAITE